MELNTSDFIYVFEKETNQKISAYQKITQNISMIHWFYLL